MGFSCFSEVESVGTASCHPGVCVRLRTPRPSSTLISAHPAGGAWLAFMPIFVVYLPVDCCSASVEQHENINHCVLCTMLTLCLARCTSKTTRFVRGMGGSAMVQHLVRRGFSPMPEAIWPESVGFKFSVCMNCICISAHRRLPDWSGSLLAKDISNKQPCKARHLYPQAGLQSRQFAGVCCRWCTSALTELCGLGWSHASIHLSPWAASPAQTLFAWSLAPARSILSPLSHVGDPTSCHLSCCGATVSMGTMHWGRFSNWPL